jgi:hypothetical protein
LLEGNTFFVELFGVFSDLYDIFVHLEAHFRKHTRIFYKGYELVTVVNLQEATSLIVELHELTAHLEFLFLVRVINCLENGIVPSREEAIFIIFNVLADIFALLVKFLHRWKITK